MSTTPLYNQQVINIGAQPNDGVGDPLRVAFEKVNNNFSNLFATFVNSTIAYTFGNTAGQVIFQYPANAFSEGQFYIQSSDTGTPDRQNIQLFAQINPAHDTIKFSGYGSTFFGNCTSRYNMDVASGNVRILASPLVDDDMTHFISSQIMWTGPNVPGMYISPDGYANSSIATETVVNITTEQPAP